MKAIAVTCPHCGARVQVTGTADTTRCEYCGTVSVVQRRTRVLERVLPPPPNQQRMPVAVQRRGGATVVAALGTLLPIGIGIGATMYAQRVAQQAVSTANTAISSHAKPHAADAPDWQGTDGAIVLPSGDILGRSRRVRQTDEVRAVLIDGATGAPRWESAPLGTYSDTYQGKLALAGDLVVFASPRAEVRALALADGKERWRTQLAERVAQLCDGGGDVVIAIGTDDVARPLLRATGKPAGTLGNALELEPKPKRKPKAKPCTRLPTDGDDAAATPSSSNYDLGRKLDLSIHRILPLPDGRLVSGQRDKGTRVPTLVRLDAKQRVQWRVDVPIDPLGSQERAPEALTAGEHEACAAYYAKNITEPPHLACFALADGHRTWDSVAADRSISMLRIVPRGLLVGSSGTLELRDLATGTLRWTFGG